MKRLLPLIVFMLFLMNTKVAFTLFPSPEDWRDQIIYQIITDRFFDGDTVNNTANPDGNYSPADAAGIHGGDFKGITKKLDYLKNLGVTAIWISPVVRNVNGAYHGYHALDFYQIDPHWGTLSDLQELISEAHRRGIYVIFDIVVNHCGDLIGSFDPGYPAYKAPPDGYTLSYWNASRQYPPPFSNLTLYHNHGAIQNYTDPEQILGELFGLDDLRTELPYVRENMISIYTTLVALTDCDGMRIDTAKHVEIEFWQTFCPALRNFLSPLGKTNFFMFGEVWDGDYKCGYYTGRVAVGGDTTKPFALNSVLDYPLYFITNNVFAKANAPTSELDSHYSNITIYYDPEAWNRLVTFLDNHDNPRFLSTSLANNDLARLKLALVFQLTSLGIPCIYYGTEQAFNGGGWDYSREDMFDGEFEYGPSEGDNFNQTHELFLFIQKLANLRRLMPALRRGSQTTLENNSRGPGIYAYSRRYENEEVIVILNTSNSLQTTGILPTNYQPNTILKNFLSDETVIVDNNKCIGPITLSPRDAKIYLPAYVRLLLPPTVIQIEPKHDSKYISLDSNIVVYFSQPMNTFSVESAFSTIPASQGQFIWNSHKTIMTYLPNTTWVPNQLYTVRIEGSACDTSGLCLCGAFESIFKTAIDTTIEYPPPPPPDILHFGPLFPSKVKITVDGDTTEWKGCNTQEGTGVIDTTINCFIWKDYLDDDLGDGDYTYPTASVFTEGDADFDEIRVAWDSTYLYFFIKPKSINPNASFYTPYFGIAIDTDGIYFSGCTVLGIVLDGPRGSTEAVLNPYLASEFEVAAPVPGMRSPILLASDNRNLSAGVLASVSQKTGVLELAVPLSTIGNPEGKTWNFVFYSALETYGTVREIMRNRSTWSPGGGYDEDAEGNDPDIFDLIGSSIENQISDLNNYYGLTPSMISHSAISITFGSSTFIGEWQLY